MTCALLFQFLVFLNWRKNVFIRNSVCVYVCVLQISWFMKYSFKTQFTFQFQKKFNDKTPYTIMFGPDKCGMDSKVGKISTWTSFMYRTFWLAGLNWKYWSLTRAHKANQLLECNGFDLTTHPRVKHIFTLYTSFDFGANVWIFLIFTLKVGAFYIDAPCSCQNTIMSWRWQSLCIHVVDKNFCSSFAVWIRPWGFLLD